MMADNIEHVISYWFIFQKFHSPALGGFAVVSHWLPFLLFSVSIGALAERIDPRRIVQCGMVLFIIASSAWAFFFLTNLLTIWSAMLVLVVHGCAGVFLQTPTQLLLHSFVPPQDLPSAVRLNSTARYMGFLVGPAVGGAIMLVLGPSKGIIVNTLFYVPMVIWMFRAPKPVRHDAVKIPFRGLADFGATIRIIAPNAILTSMTILAGLTSFLIGNAYSAQMPGFANDLGHGDAGLSYSLLLAADAGGAMCAGILLESWGQMRSSPRIAIGLAACWAGALIAFAVSSSFPVAVAFLFAAGFCELSFNTMAQALVQVHAPVEAKGRVIGLFNMGSLGMRTFSGLSVGLLGAWIGIHWSLALAGAAVLICLATMAWLYVPSNPSVQKVARST